MNIKQLQKDVLKKQSSSTKKWKEASAATIFRVGTTEIVVNPRVFSPKPDSVLLATKMRVNPGEVVLDTCAGTGIQTIYAIKKGAAKVYSCDINPDAVANIKLNVKKYKFGMKVKVFRANLFPKIDTRVNVLIANPPYTDHKTCDVIEKSVWDKNHLTLKKLLKEAPEYLQPKGRMYLSWASTAY